MMRRFATIEPVFMLLSCLHSVSGQCFRALKYEYATADYQEFTSPGYPLYYYTSRQCMWRFVADNETHAIRLDIIDCSIEYDADCQFDFCQVFDGDTISNPSLGKFCGTSTPTFVSTNNTMMLVFTSDASVTSRGFKARYKSGPRASLLVDEDDASNTGVIIGATCGVVAFVVVVAIVVAVACKHLKAKTSATPRPQSRPRTSIRVRPCDDDDVSNYYDTYFPPAYEDIQASSPPGYSFSDNYNVNARFAALPRRIDDMPGNEKCSDKKAPWMKEPLDTMHGLDAVTNTHFIHSSNRRETVTNIGIDGPHCPLPGASGISTAGTKNANLKKGAGEAGTSNAVRMRFQSGKSHIGASGVSEGATHKIEHHPGKERTSITASNRDRASSGISLSKPEDEMVFSRKSLNKHSFKSSHGKSLIKNVKPPHKRLSDDIKLSANQASNTVDIENPQRSSVSVTPEHWEVMAEDIESVISEMSL